jgi:exodeoxyribonuclease V alpha subunit
VWDCIVPLTRSYRYRSESGIGRLASAINAGDVDAALATLASGDGVTRVDPAPIGQLGAVAEAAIREGYAPYLGCREPLDRLTALARFRVLCAHRRGPRGVDTVNAHIEALLAAGSPFRPAGAEYAGRPILITQNDYRLQLFNGDVGVIAEDDQQHGRLVAIFQNADGAPRHIAPARLPAHETVFATSIHKSQGSEFDAVAIVLPDVPSPLISRELLYTAVTRARRGVLICATPALIAHAVTHRLERASGLRDALWTE